MRLRIVICGLVFLLLLAGCSSEPDNNEVVDLLTSDVWVSETGERMTFLDSYVGNIDNKAKTYAFTWNVISEKSSDYNITVRRKDGSLILDDDFLLKYDGEIPVLIDTFWDIHYVRECDLP